MTVVVDGVAEVRLDLGRSLAHVTWDPNTTELSAGGFFRARHHDDSEPGARNPSQPETQVRKNELSILLTRAD